MVDVVQLPYGSDNFGYLVFSGGDAIAIDPGDPKGIMKIIDNKKLTLKAIVNTHSHYDHTLGNSELEELSGVGVVQSLPAKYELGNDEIKVIKTPGHTDDGVCFVGPGFVITGDTLFIANVGNPSGDVAVFKESLDKLLTFDDSFIVYPGHDYTKRSLDRALTIFKNCDDVEVFLSRYSPPPVASTIGDERKINPYLRTSRSDVVEHIEAKGKSTKDELDCFRSFLELY